ncbi:MAG: hypothetical protein ACRCXD_12830 [Luteolibacter sp.]
MKFYTVRAMVEAGGKYAWSDGYCPMNFMPFLDLVEETIRARRFEFWRINPGMAGVTIYQGGSEWPDCIGVGLGWPHECYSDRVIKDLEASGIKIWRKTEMPIAEINSKRLQKKNPPKYYVIEAGPGIETDYKASGVPLDANGKPDLVKRDKSHTGPYAVSLSSWNGEHLVSPHDREPMYALWSEVAKEICEEKGWTNFRFDEVPVV